MFNGGEMEAFLSGLDRGVYAVSVEQHERPQGLMGLAHFPGLAIVTGLFVLTLVLFLLQPAKLSI